MRLIQMLVVCMHRAVALCHDSRCTSGGGDCCAPEETGEDARCKGHYHAVRTGKGCWGYGEGVYRCCDEAADIVAAQPGTYCHSGLFQDTDTAQCSSDCGKIATTARACHYCRCRACARCYTFVAKERHPMTPHALPPPRAPPLPPLPRSPPRPSAPLPPAPGLQVAEADGLEVAEAERLEVAEADRLEVAEADRPDVAEVDSLEVAEADRLEVVKADRLEPALRPICCRWTEAPIG